MPTDDPVAAPAVALGWRDIAGTIAADIARDESLTPLSRRRMSSDTLAPFAWA
jgi:hypothetical protein